MFKRTDGIVDFDKSICIGCKACMAACPYDAIFINPDDHSAEKCNFCAHRIDMQLEPACVVVCPTQAILVGDLNDSDSYVAQLINRDTVAVRRPEKETLPKLFYKGAHQATLDPLAAKRPEGGLFMWSEQQEGPGLVTSGNPNFSNSSAAALLSYDVAHSIPWDWRVSLYTWTKGIASGVYLIACLLVLLGVLNVNNSIWLWATPIISGGFLALTGALLIWDLEHPERFFLIFTRPQWRSWLVKGAFIIAGYTLVLLLHFIASWVGSTWFQSRLMIAGVPLSLLTAIYTAYLFAQAKARDMWQNPLLPPHLVVQAALLGSAVLLPFAGTESFVLQWILAISSAVHLLTIWGEVSLTHPTAHARLAIWEMVQGRYMSDFWIGTTLSIIGGLLPLLAVLGFVNPVIGVGGAPFALIGLMLFENAYVQAAQSVPIA
jgi:formate-dependent nitrite reductase membrane component NrfD/ferredoxin